VADITCNGPLTLDGIKGVGQPAPKDAPLPYTVRDGKVDARTHIGWLRFAGFCERCHGPGGMGSTIAPDLTAAIKTLNRQQFNTIVKCGLTGDIGAGVMPAWGDNPNVMPYIGNLYAYLRARGDGALGPGRPGRFDEKPVAAGPAGHP
jgi:mono/diheme cytochrome c family protein